MNLLRLLKMLDKKYSTNSGPIIKIVKFIFEKAIIIIASKSLANTMVMALDKDQCDQAEVYCPDLIEKLI